MPPAQHQTACCLRQKPLPQTLSELETVVTLRPLGDSIEPLALIGTEFSDALITTQNAGALISGRGGYGPLQTTASPCKVSRSDQRQDLRISPLSPVRIASHAAIHDAGIRPALLAFDHSGRVQHRVQFNAAQDEIIAASLPEEHATTAAPAQDTPSEVIDLQAVRHQRAGWSGSSPERHLNAFLDGQGASRRRCLPYLKPGHSRQIRVDVVPSLLAFFGRRGVSFCRWVVGEGMLHADVGTLPEVGAAGDTILAQAQTQSFALHMSQVSDGWVSTTRGGYLLELYGHDQKAIAVLGADPFRCKRAWSDLMLSLPSVS